MLCLGIEDAEVIASRFADEVGGPVVSHQPRLQDWWASLLAPAREVQEAVPDEDIELIADDPGELCVYSQEDLAVARTVLMEALRTPVRLSQLLEQALAHTVEAADLLAISALRASPPIPRRTRRRTSRTSWQTCSVNSWWCSMTAQSSTSAHSPAVTCCSSPPSR